MKTKSNSSSSVTIGLDLGDRRHAMCVLDASSGIHKQESITNTRESFSALKGSKREWTPIDANVQGWILGGLDFSQNPLHS